MPALDAAAHRHAHHQGRRVLAARPIAELRELVHDLIEGRIDVVTELDLRHRAQPIEGHPDGRADDSRLGERGVDAAILPELFLQADGGAEHAAEAADVLAQNDHPPVPAHFEPERVVHRL